MLWEFVVFAYYFTVFSTLLTPLSTELGSRPLEEEHMIVDKPYKPAKTTRSKQRKYIQKLLTERNIKGLFKGN